MNQADALIGNYAPEYYMFNNSKILGTVLNAISPFVADLMAYDAAVVPNALPTYESEALMPMLLETEPNVQDDFLELLSCNGNPDIMMAVVQAVDFTRTERSARHGSRTLPQPLWLSKT